MQVNIIAVLAATVAMFAVGAFWYMVPFGKIWGKIHDFDKLTPKQQKDMQAKMGPWYGVQLVVTLLSAFVLAGLISLLPQYSPYVIAVLVWLGFVVPTEASAMIFGGSKPEYVWHKIFISIGESLLHLLIAAFVIQALQ
jgi:sterol desaturase/sphingolipid hydroxylase (fatty acid hydroxylase superfamily)